MVRGARHIHASPFNSALYATSQNRQLYDRLTLHGFDLHFRCITHSEGHQGIRGEQQQQQQQHGYKVGSDFSSLHVHARVFGNTSLRERRRAKLAAACNRRAMNHFVQYRESTYVLRHPGNGSRESFSAQRPYVNAWFSSLGACLSKYRTGSERSGMSL